MSLSPGSHCSTSSDVSSISQPQQPQQFNSYYSQQQYSQQQQLQPSPTHQQQAHHLSSYFPTPAPTPPPNINYHHYNNYPEPLPQLQHQPLPYNNYNSNNWTQNQTHVHAHSHSNGGYNSYYPQSQHHNHYPNNYQAQSQLSPSPQSSPNSLASLSQFVNSSSPPPQPHQHQQLNPLTSASSTGNDICPSPLPSPTCTSPLGNGGSLAQYRSQSPTRPLPAASPSMMMPVRLQNMVNGARTKAGMRKLLQEQGTPTPVTPSLPPVTAQQSPECPQNLSQTDASHKSTISTSPKKSPSKKPSQKSKLKIHMHKSHSAAKESAPNKSSSTTQVFEFPVHSPEAEAAAASIEQAIEAALRRSRKISTPSTTTTTTSLNNSTMGRRKDSKNKPKVPVPVSEVSGNPGPPPLPLTPNSKSGIGGWSVETLESANATGTTKFQKLKIRKVPTQTNPTSTSSLGPKSLTNKISNKRPNPRPSKTRSPIKLRKMDKSEAPTTKSTQSSLTANPIPTASGSPVKSRKKQATNAQVPASPAKVPILPAAIVSANTKTKTPAKKRRKRGVLTSYRKRRGRKGKSKSKVVRKVKVTHPTGLLSEDKEPNTAPVPHQATGVTTEQPSTQSVKQKLKPKTTAPVPEKSEKTGGPVEGESESTPTPPSTSVPTQDTNQTVRTKRKWVRKKPYIPIAVRRAQAAAAAEISQQSQTPPLDSTLVLISKKKKESHGSGKDTEALIQDLLPAQAKPTSKTPKNSKKSKISKLVEKLGVALSKNKKQKAKSLGVEAGTRTSETSSTSSISITEALDFTAKFPTPASSPGKNKSTPSASPSPIIPKTLCSTRSLRSSSVDLTSTTDFQCDAQVILPVIIMNSNPNLNARKRKSKTLSGAAAVQAQKRRLRLMGISASESTEPNAKSPRKSKSPEKSSSAGTLRSVVETKETGTVRKSQSPARISSGSSTVSGPSESCSRTGSARKWKSVSPEKTPVSPVRSNNRKSPGKRTLESVRKSLEASECGGTKVCNSAVIVESAGTSTTGSRIVRKKFPPAVPLTQQNGSPAPTSKARTSALSIAKALKAKRTNSAPSTPGSSEKMDFGPGPVIINSPDGGPRVWVGKTSSAPLLSSSSSGVPSCSRNIGPSVRVKNGRAKVSGVGGSGSGEGEQGALSSGGSTTIKEILSTTFDPDVRNECVFCTLAPYCERMGPLFGPYYTEPGHHETWLHEDCICWNFVMTPTPSGTLRNLSEAVTEALQVECYICDRAGAYLECRNRDCDRVAHIPCARINGWRMNPTNFHSYCKFHKHEDPEPLPNPAPWLMM